MKTFQKYVPLLTVVILIVAWWILSAVKNDALLYPKPNEIFDQMINIFGTAKFYRSIGGSLVRVAVSFIVAFVLAIVLALISNVSKTFERVLYPIILVVRATPTMCIIFLCVLWFKPSITPMVVAGAVIFPTMYGSVLTAIKSCDEDLIEMSDVYKVPTMTRIKKLYLPFVGKRVYADAVNAVSLNVKLIIAAEAISQTPKSLGLLMQMSYGVFEIAALFAYTLTALILSFLLESLLKLIGFLVRRLRYAKIS